MIDIYDCEALVKSYRLLDKKCAVVDKFINNYAIYFGPAEYNFGSLDVCNNILDLMERKNQLINLKLIIDHAVKSLNEFDRKLISIKLHYNLTQEEICEVLNVKLRTLYRKADRAMVNLTIALNQSQFNSKLQNILHKEIWITNLSRNVREKKLSFQYANC